MTECNQYTLPAPILTLEMVRGFSPLRGNELGITALPLSYTPASFRPAAVAPPVDDRGSAEVHSMTECNQYTLPAPHPLSGGGPEGDFPLRRNELGEESSNLVTRTSLLRRSRG